MAFQHLRPYDGSLVSCSRVVVWLRGLWAGWNGWRQGAKLGGGPHSLFFSCVAVEPKCSSETISGLFSRRLSCTSSTLQDLRYLCAGAGCSAAHCAIMRAIDATSPAEHIENTTRSVSSMRHGSLRCSCGGIAAKDYPRRGFGLRNCLLAVVWGLGFGAWCIRLRAR